MDVTGTAAVATQVVVTGLAAGATYALLAIGVALLYRMTSVLQLAHGHVAALGIVTALAVVGSLGSTPSRSPVRLLLGVIVAMAVAAAVSAAVPLLAWRGSSARVRSDARWLAIVVATAFAIEALLAVVSRRSGYVLPEVLPGGQARVGLPGGAAVSGHALWQLGLALVLAGAVDALMRRTRAGTLVSAVASEPRLAELAGLPVRAAVLGSFGAAGALAAVAGVLATSGSTVSAADGVSLGLWGLAAAAVARFGERRRIVVVALALGLLESVAVNVGLPVLDGARLGPAGAAVIPVVATVLALALRAESATREVAA